MRSRTWLTAGLLALLAGIPAAQAEPGSWVPGADQPPLGRIVDPSRAPGQTSEGIEGPHVTAAMRGATGRVAARPVPTRVRHWQIAPGIAFRQWDERTRRGQVRLYLLRVDPAAPGVSLDAVSGPQVVDRAPLSTLLRDDGAIAGVNGGFFDISDTGAPLGVGRDRQRGLLHASLGTWDKAFWISESGRARIGTAVLQATIDQQPQVEVTNVNGARVKIDGVGIYTPEWGITSGYRITDGQTRSVRQVVVEDGRVVSNRTSITAGDPIGGYVLVGRGQGSAELAEMPVGSTATLRWQLRGTPAIAVGGEKVLLQNGRRLVVDDTELHPRTAIGIDRDTGKVLLLVVDGRQSFSRGYTMVELARAMKRLGAEDALNLDGGGSSTMVAPDRDGTVSVRNSPSDGAQRSVPEGVAVHYQAPRQRGR